MIAATASALGLVAVMPAAASASRVRGAPARERAFHNYARTHQGSSTASNDSDLEGQFAEYGFARTAPAATVSGQALLRARAQAAALPTTGGGWTDVTTKPYNAEPPNYTDPFWSNIGAGLGLVGGRTTALVQTTAGTWLAGTADGGVWRSTNHGATWKPVFDRMPTLSIGALGLAPDGSVWVGTGEANTSQDSYAGTGVYRSTTDGKSWTAVRSADNSNPIVGRTVFRVAFDGSTALAATNNGLWRYSGGNWSEVLAPAPTGDPQPYYDNQVTDVAVDPANPNTVVAAVGWRGPLTPDSANSFYVSSNGGATFTAITPTGDIDATDIGRTTFAYSADGSRLYAVVESPSAEASGAATVLQGVFVSADGNPAGPWTLIADASTLDKAGAEIALIGEQPGVQAWYNQDLAVDPANPKHVYLGLEEVYESSDGGSTWDVASPYFNVFLSCGSSCPNTTHPDQHAMMIADGKIVIGNDGGVYSRPLSDSGLGDWSDLNATLGSWQYYDARAGILPTGGVGVWGGLQDNGSALFDPNQSQMVEPAGGDGGNVIVDPRNADRFTGEYVDMTMYSTTDGGHSFADFVSPGCAAQAITGLPRPRRNCDPSARFIAPITADQDNVNHWVVGGQYVWESTHGWATKCGDTGCDWARLFNTGSGHVVTALSAANGTIYAAWVNGGGNPDPTFAVGIATNAGGTWRQLSMAGLPNRIISGITVDKSNPNHAIVVFNGFSRRWIPGGGNGHVFETFDGGSNWTDIDGNLPDAPGDALAMVGSKLVLATDVGVFEALEGTTTWSRLGTGLPAASVNDITIGPDGNTVYAATHGRGVWSVTP